MIDKQKLKRTIDFRKQMDSEARKDGVPVETLFGITFVDPPQWVGTPRNIVPEVPPSLTFLDRLRILLS